MKKKSISLQKEFGAQVRRLRTEQGLSQEELAFSAGLDRTYVSGIERGTRNVSLNNIGKIAKALKISLKVLFSF